MYSYEFCEFHFSTQPEEIEYHIFMQSQRTDSSIKEFSIQLKIGISTRFLILRIVYRIAPTTLSSYRPYYSVLLLAVPMTRPMVG